MRQLKITKSITNRESASLDKYLQEIGKEEMISMDEEVELAQRIRKGDRKALEKLTRANLRFVVSVAKPVLAGTMSGVMNVEKKTIDSAKVLNVGKFTMLFSVILPASLQQIFIGCNQGLTVSFVLLTSAEMIGAQSGLGYYIKNYSDFGDYTRTIVGLIVVGIVIVAISFLFNRIQKFLLRWKQ